MRCLVILAVVMASVWANGDTQVLTTRGGGALYNETRSNASNAVYRIAVNAVANSSSGITITLANSFEETANTNPIRVGAAWEDPVTATITPFLFSGIRTNTVAGGALLTSDVLAVPTVAGRGYYVRLLVEVDAGNQYYMGSSVKNTYAGRSGEGFSYLNTSPLTTLDSGTITPNSAGAYGFVAVRGDASQVPSVAIYGDSISASGVLEDDLSYIIWALGGQAAATNSYVNVSQSGETAAQFLANHTQRMAMTTNMMFGLCEYGRNDITLGHSLATIQSDLTNTWTLLKDSGKRVYQMTITPRTADSSGEKAIRTALNSWIMTTPAPLDGYFDVTPYCETVPNSSDTWIAGISDDGTHPNASGAQTMGIALQSSFASVFKAGITPEDYLESLPKPSFRPGHHLPRLGVWWGATYAIPLRVELATNWFYGLSLNGSHGLEDLSDDLANPASVPAQVLAIHLARPSVLPLDVRVDRVFPYLTYDHLTLSSGMYCTNSAGLYLKGDGTTTVIKTQGVISPESDTNEWNSIASWTANPLAILVASNATIAVIQHGGEDGIGVVGQEGAGWRYDPRVIARTNGMSSWMGYANPLKGRQQDIVGNAIRAAVPNRGVFVWYESCKWEQARWTADGYDWWNEWSLWGWWSRYTRTSSDVVSFESYYQKNWTDTNTGAIDLPNDILTKYLNGVGYQIAQFGARTNYSYLCGGWLTGLGQGLGDSNLYTGFLKCAYVGGMVGGVAGYFDSNWNDGTSTITYTSNFNATNPPPWITQAVALSRVHALFTYLEDYILDGDLLPGPYLNPKSKDQPAYEFTAYAPGQSKRVLVRKRTGVNDWLVAAWAADGVQSDVTVTIPTLGTKTLTALPEGNLYRGTTTTFGPVNQYGEIMSLPKVSHLHVNSILGK